MSPLSLNFEITIQGTPLNDNLDEGNDQTQYIFGSLVQPVIFIQKILYILLIDWLVSSFILHPRYKNVSTPHPPKFLHHGIL